MYSQRIPGRNGTGAMMQRPGGSLAPPVNLPGQYDTGSDTQGYYNKFGSSIGGGAGAGLGVGAGAGLGVGTGPSSGNAAVPGGSVSGGGLYGAFSPTDYGPNGYDPAAAMAAAIASGKLTGDSGRGPTINFGEKDPHGRAPNYDAGINMYYPNNNLGDYRPPASSGNTSYNNSGLISPMPPSGGGGVRPRPSGGVGGSRPVEPGTNGVGWQNPYGGGNTAPNRPVRPGGTPYSPRPQPGYSGTGRIIPGGPADPNGPIGSRGTSGGGIQLDSATRGGSGAINYTQGGGPRPSAAVNTSNFSGVSPGSWTPAPIASARPINIGGLYGAISGANGQAAANAQAAAQQQAAAPGIVRIPRDPYFGNPQLGFNAGTSNMGFQQGMVNGQYFMTNPGTSGFGSGWGGDLPVGQDPLTIARQQANAAPKPPKRGQPGYTDPQTGVTVPGGQVQYDPNDPMGSLIGAFQQAQNSALDTNEQRYNDILAGYGSMYDTTLNSIQNLGSDQLRKLDESYANKGKGIRSDMVSRGMTNTTSQDALLNENFSEWQEAIPALENAIMREKLANVNPIFQNRLNFMERREDQYPDMAQLMALSQMMGMSGNGTGSLGGGGGFNPGAAGAAMAGVGNAGALPGAGGFGGAAAGFGGANGNMGNVWGNQGIGQVQGQQQNQVNNQQNAVQLAQLEQQMISPITGKKLNPYQWALLLANLKKQGMDDNPASPNFGNPIQQQVPFGMGPGDVVAQNDPYGSLTPYSNYGSYGGNNYFDPGSLFGFEAPVYNAAPTPSPGYQSSPGYSSYI